MSLQHERHSVGNSECALPEMETDQCRQRIPNRERWPRWGEKMFPRQYYRSNAGARASHHHNKTAPHHTSVRTSVTAVLYCRLSPPSPCVVGVHCLNITTTQYIKKEVQCCSTLTNNSVFPPLFQTKSKKSQNTHIHTHTQAHAQHL